MTRRFFSVVRRVLGCCWRASSQPPSLRQRDRWNWKRSVSGFCQPSARQRVAFSQPTAPSDDIPGDFTRPKQDVERPVLLLRNKGQPSGYQGLKVSWIRVSQVGQQLQFAGEVMEAHQFDDVVRDFQPCGILVAHEDISSHPPRVLALQQSRERLELGFLQKW